MMERIEKTRASDDAFDLVFRKARTYNAWLPKPVPDELLQQLYDTLKWGPTSANMCPARFLFIRSTAAKERLRPSLAPGNVEKTMAAPVTVIIAYDLKFSTSCPGCFPTTPPCAICL
jgi:3-hydroxypropanoate dehydrogenase